MAKALDVWLYGTHIATITEDSRERLGLTWTEDALRRWGPGARLLSATLPIGSTIPSSLVKNYIDGLLPEGNARVNHALEAGVGHDDSLALIGVFGRDTPGAAIFTPEGSKDPSAAGTYVPLTDDEVAERLRSADSFSRARSRADTESSTLPGMVPKVTLHRENDQWFACRDGAASTWILKRSADVGSPARDVVDTEVAALSLARELGITSIDAELFEHAGVRGIAVSRYDRTGGGRIHQEDLAQAIGLNTLDANRKFQWGARMPSLAHAAEVLETGGGNRDDLLRLTTFSHLVGNTDMHAKNISFLRHPDGRVELAPAYDIAMHMHHVREGRRSALDVNSKHAMNDISFEDLVSEGRGWGLSDRRARAVVESTAAALATALSNIDRAEHAGVPDEAWDVVTNRSFAASDPIIRSLALTPPEPSSSELPPAGSETVRSHVNASREVKQYTRKRRGPRPR